MTLHTPSILMQHLLTVALQAAALTALVGAVAFVFRRQLSPRWRHRLWWIVVIRLAIPVLPTSPVSLYQWLPAPITSQHVPPAAEHAQTPATMPQAHKRNAPLPTIGGDSRTLSPPHSPTLTDPLAETQLPLEPVQPGTQTTSDTRTVAVTRLPAPRAQDTATNTPAKARTAWWWPVAFIVWLGVAVALALRTTLGWLMLKRRVRSDSSAASERATALLLHEARTLGIKSPLALLETSCIPGPTLLGVFRPSLLMPPGLAQSLDDDALRLIFRHELCHLRGRDNLANWLFAFLQAAHWFNPLVWWAFTQLRAQRELARDAQTVQSRPAATPDNTQRENARQYADALLAVVRFSVEHKAARMLPSPVTSAAVRDRRHLARRLAMLEHANRFCLRHTLFACALLIALVTTSLTVAQDRAPTAQDIQKQAEETQPPQRANLQASATDQAEDASEQAENEAAQTARQIITVSWEDVSFDAAVAHLEQQAGLQITFDPVIQDAIDALAPQPRISLTLARVPMEQALNFAMKQLFSDRLGEALAPVDWKWTLDDGVLNLGLETVDTRVYDIRDLIVPIPPNLSKAPWTDEEEETARQECTRQLRTLIQETAGQPEHWSEQYAETEYGGTIRELNGNCIIRTTPTNHRAILGLLLRLREGRGDQISFETDLLLLDNETFTEVFSQDIEGFRSAFVGFQGIHPSRLKNPAGGPDEPQIGEYTADVRGIEFITDQQRTDVLERVSQSDSTLRMSLPRITLFNGHQAYLMVAKQIAFISTLDQIPGHEQLAPTLSVAQTGALLVLESTISADRSYATTTINFEASAQAGPTIELPRLDEQGQQVGFTEFLQLDHVEIRLTVSIPDEGWMIIVGPLIHGRMERGVPDGDDPAEYTDTRRVVLLIKPTIVEQQEQEIEIDAAFPEGLPESE